MKKTSSRKTRQRARLPDAFGNVPRSDDPESDDQGSWEQLLEDLSGLQRLSSLQTDLIRHVERQVNQLREQFDPKKP